MRHRWWVRLVLAVVLAPGAAVASPPSLAVAADTRRSGPTSERPTVEALLERAAWYLDFFVDQFENVVAEESYIQDSSMPLPTMAPGTGRGGPFALPPSASDLIRARHRDLKSDFLLVKSPDTSALVPFRDVIAVDGAPVRDREARLARLFMNPDADAMRQAARVGEESARYNLGNMRSTIGNPVLALGALQLSYQARFKFALGKADRSMGPSVWELDYNEVASPAMIKGQAGADLPAHGRFWIEAATGRVLRTELFVEEPSIRARVITTFRLDERFAIAVPVEMREQYTFATGSRVSMLATYGRFRRFDVRADEVIRMPTRTITDEASGVTLVEIPAGRFTMGSAASEPGRGADEVLHDVTISHPFFLARYEVTQREWRSVMGTAPSVFASCGPKCPVEAVSFVQVQQFLDKLNAKPSAFRYRLPTEAEWEYACRAGTAGPFSTGDDLSTSQANYNGRFPYADSPAGEYRQRPVPVGSFALNPWGLADMHGNVWEWTADWYGPYEENGPGTIDPAGPPSGQKRVIRGGSWYTDGNSARCALRYTHTPTDRGFSLGFRLAADRR